MNVGVKKLTRISTHSKISDYHYEIEAMDIQGQRQGIISDWLIQKLCEPWVGARTAINKKRIFVNRKDWNTHGYDDSFDED
jgi:hypothetical protein